MAETMQWRSVADVRADDICEQPNNFADGAEFVNPMALADDLLLIRKAAVEIRIMYREKMEASQNIGLHVQEERLSCMRASTNTFSRRRASTCWACVDDQGSLVAEPHQALESRGVPRSLLGLYSAALKGGRDPDRRSGNTSYYEDHDDIAQD